MTFPATNNPKTPVRPSTLSKDGNKDVMIKVQNQHVRLHIEMQMPRTLVGKISEHMMLGITPNPMQNTLSKIITLIAVITALRSELMWNKFRKTSTRRDNIRTGMVYNIIDLP